MMGRIPGFDRKLAFFAALAGLACTAVTGSLAYWLASQALREAARAHAQATSARVSARVGDELRSLEARSRQYLSQSERKAFETDGDFLALSLLKKPSQPSAEHGDWHPHLRWLLPAGDPSRLGASDLEQADLKHPVDVERISQGHSEALFASTPGAPALLRLAFPYGERADDEYSQVVVADIKMSKVQGLFAHRRDLFLFLVGARGELVIASDSGHFTPSEDLSRLPVIQVARKAPDGAGALDYSETPDAGLQYAGYHRVPGDSGLIVVAQVPREQALTALAPVWQGLAAAGGVFGLLFGLGAGWIGARSLRERVNLAELAKLATQSSGSDPGAGAPAPLNPPASASAAEAIYAKVQDPVQRRAFENGQVNLAGQKLDAPVLHAHVHGLDRLSGQVEASHLLALLNDFNQRVAGAIQSRHGIVDHMHGGSIVAFWGVPKPREDSVGCAIESAREIRDAFRKLSQSLPPNTQGLRLGMGLHYGPLAAGQVGIEGRLEYSAIGEAVEVAGRIHQFTDQFGTDFVLTGAAASRAGNAFATERLTAGDDQTPELFELSDKAA